ncbi:integrator complex assembly factor BRAT1-like [Glandiceps talaboti]
MESEIIEKCMERLPDVFGVLLDPNKTIVDDTCIEKLLGWLKKVVNNAGTRPLLTNEKSGLKLFLHRIATSVCEPHTLAFGLKVIKLLCNHPITEEDSENQASSTNQISVTWDDIILTVLRRAKDDLEYWDDASVRFAWFDTVDAMVTSSHSIIYQIEIVDAAIACLTDKSMFVTAAAQGVLVSVIIETYKTDDAARDNGPGGKEIDDHSEGNGHTNDACENAYSKNSMQAVHDDKMTIKCEYLSSAYKQVKKSLEEILVVRQTTSLKQKHDLVISVMQLFKKLFEVDASVGSLVSMATDVVSHCSEMIENDCSDEISYIIELFMVMLQKTSLDSMEKWLKIDVLIKMVTSLLEKGSINVALRLATALSCKQPIKELFEVVTSPIQIILGERTPDSLPSSYNMLLETLSSRSGCISLIYQSLNAVRDVLLKNLESIAKSQISDSVCKLLEISSTDNPNNIPTRFAINIVNSSKLTKAILDLVVCNEIILGGSSARMICEVSIKLLDNPQSECTVVNKALTAIVSILQICYKSQLDTEHDDTPCQAKKPRLDSSDQILSASFANVLQKRSYDSRWEIRDSILNFMEEIIRRFPGNAFIMVWLIEHKLYMLPWEKVRDSESYVRASALQALSGLSLYDGLWQAFLTTTGITQEYVVQAVIDILLHDDEGFARRAAVSAVVLWFSQHQGIRTLTLAKQPQQESHEGCGDEQNLDSSIAGDEGSSTKTDYSRAHDQVEVDADIDNKEQTVGENITDSAIKGVCENIQDDKTAVFDAMIQASRDFDFEVKLSVIDFWENVFKHFNPGYQSSTEPCMPDYMKAVSNIQPKICSQDVAVCGVQEVCKTQCLKTLQAMLDDYDRIVSEKTCKILINIKHYITTNIPDINALLQHQIDDTTHKDLKNFRDFILSNDFNAMLKEKERSTDMYEQNPLSLLEDILSCVDDNEDNLLDCY